MADSKITALTALTAADPVNDMFPVVDVSDTTMAASGTTKKISVNNILGASGTATLASATITGAATVGTTLGVTGVSSFAAGTALLPALTRTGDTNTGIYYPAADTFAVTTGGTERYRVDSSGNLLLGTTAAAGRLQVAGSAVGAGIFTVDSDVTRVDIQTYNKPLSINRSGNDVNICESSGNVGIGTVAVGTGGCLQLKSGITFPATQVASSDANTLDDYEEGTWTGTLTGGTTNPTTPVTATGRYTKVGRSVTVQITFSAVNTTGASGLIGITGLPFANNSVSNSVGSVSLYLIANFTGSPFASLGVNESFINFYSNNSGGAFLDVTHNAGTPRFLSVSITYTV